MDNDPNPLRNKLVAALRAQGLSDYEIGYGLGRRTAEHGFPPNPGLHPGCDVQGYHDGYTETERLS